MTIEANVNVSNKIDEVFGAGSTWADLAAKAEEVGLTWDDLGKYRLFKAKPGGWFYSSWESALCGAVLSLDDLEEFDHASTAAGIAYFEYLNDKEKVDYGVSVRVGHGDDNYLWVEIESVGAVDIEDIGWAGEDGVRRDLYLDQVVKCKTITDLQNLFDEIKEAGEMGVDRIDRSIEPPDMYDREWESDFWSKIEDDYEIDVDDLAGSSQQEIDDLILLLAKGEAERNGSFIDFYAARDRYESFAGLESVKSAPSPGSAAGLFVNPFAGGRRPAGDAGEGRAAADDPASKRGPTLE